MIGHEGATVTTTRRTDEAYQAWIDAARTTPIAERLVEQATADLPYAHGLLEELIDATSVAMQRWAERGASWEGRWGLLGAWGAALGVNPSAPKEQEVGS